VVMVGMRTFLIRVRDVGQGVGDFVV